MAPDSLAFPDGLVGLPDLVRFSVHEVGTSIVELVSLDDPAFGFMAASADPVRPGIRTALAERGLVDGQEAVLVLLSVHGDPPVVTANLAGPIVVTAGGVGRQVVLEGPEFPLRAPLES
jgi:flagellar assembly factor FliW